MNKEQFMEMAENLIHDYIQSHNLSPKHAIPCTIYPLWLSSNPNRPMGLFATTLNNDAHYECIYDVSAHTLTLRVFVNSENIQKEENR